MKSYLLAACMGLVLVPAISHAQETHGKMTPYDALFQAAQAGNSKNLKVQGEPEGGNSAGVPKMSQEEFESRFGSDMEAIAYGEKSDDKDKQSIAMLMKFVDSNGTMSGAAGACVPREQLYIQMCSNMVLSHWKDITGFDLNSIKMKDKDFRIKDVVKKAFAKQEDAGYAYMQSHSEECPAFIHNEQESPLWKVCERTGDAKIDPDAEKATNTGPDDTNIQ